jgi:hypothetical protein
LRVAIANGSAIVQGVGRKADSGGAGRTRGTMCLLRCNGFVNGTLALQGAHGDAIQVECEAVAGDAAPMARFVAALIRAGSIARPAH